MRITCVWHEDDTRTGMFVLLISYQPSNIFSQNKSATNHQSTVFFS
jgi:hypothetical protein